MDILYASLFFVFSGNISLRINFWVFFPYLQHFLFVCLFALPAFSEGFKATLGVFLEGFMAEA